MVIMSTVLSGVEERQDTYDVIILVVERASLTRAERLFVNR